MQKFNAKALLSEFSKLSSSDKNKKAHSNKVIKQEIKNVLEDTKIALYNQNREYANMR